MLCDPVKFFFTGHLFPQKSFKEGRTRTNHIVIYLRKNNTRNLFIYTWHKRNVFGKFTW